MIKRWQSLAEKFNAFNMRERALLAGVLIVVVFFIWDFAFLMPIQKSIDTAQLLERNAAKSMLTVNAELTVLETANKKDPDADLRRELEQLQDQLNGLDRELDAMAVGLIKAPDLPLMLQQLLTQSQSLKLLALNTLPVATIDLGLVSSEQIKDSKAQSNPALAQTPASAPAAVPHLAQLYKHGVEVKLQGSYSATYQFIKSLEASEWNFYWESLDYNVTEYPNAELTLKVFTLASDKGIFDQEPDVL